MTQAILQVKNLSLSFGDFEALRNVSFDLNPSETLALVGESGSGKSVTSLSILRLLPESTANYTNGKILFYGKQDLLKLNKKQLRQVRGNQIAMIFQEPMSSLNSLQTVFQQVEEVLIEHSPQLNKQKRYQKVLQLFQEVKIPDPKNRMYAYPHELSGGQRQRVMIAIALAMKPDILIADEPTTALDVTVEKQILELIQQLQHQKQMAVLFITHDLGVVKRIADRVCVMKNGEIVEQGAVSQIFENPKHDYTKTLLDAVLEGKKRPPDSDAPVVLDAKNVNVTFVTKTTLFGKPKEILQAVSGVSINLCQGETIGIVGESGSGKSTLGKAILRLVDTDQGSRITFKNQEIQNWNDIQMQPLRQNLQVVFQDPYSSLSPRLTALDIIAEGIRVHYPKMKEEELEQLVIKTMEQVGLVPKTRYRYPHQFSGGQRQRIAIARAVILKPDVIILDEPTSALDRNIQVQIVKLLQDLQQTYRLTYLFISHDLSVVQAISDRIIVMQSGQIVEQGSTDKLFHDPQHSYTKTLLSAALTA